MEYNDMATGCNRMKYFGALTTQVIETRNVIVRFEVLTAASTKMAVFWAVAPCSLIEVNRRFRDAASIIRAMSACLLGCCAV
jgi:hypothetical protein